MATLAFDDRNLRWHKFEADEDPTGCGVVFVVSTPLFSTIRYAAARRRPGELWHSTVVALRGR